MEKKAVARSGPRNRSLRRLLRQKTEKKAVANGEHRKQNVHRLLKEKMEREVERSEERRAKLQRLTWKEDSKLDRTHIKTNTNITVQ
jgi:hypothetical protein